MTRQANHSLLLLTIALTLASGFVIFSGFPAPVIEGELAAPAAMELIETTEVVTSEVLGARSERRQVTRRVAACKVLWSDGTPVVGATVSRVGGGATTVTGVDGAFDCCAADAGADLMIHPRCWFTPQRAKLGAVVVLPSRIDVEISARVGTHVAALLEGLQLTELSWQVEGFNAGVLMPIAQGRATAMGSRVRIPFRTSIRGSLLANGAGPLVTKELRGLTRARPLRLAFDLHSGLVVQGRIVDHRGVPLPHAAFSVDGLDPVYTSSAKGEFVCFTEPDCPIRVRASHLGRSFCSDPVRAGAQGLELRIDFRTASRIQVVKGGVPVCRYDMTLCSRLGLPEAPQLPYVADGTRWSPVTAKRSGVRVFLGWNENAVFHEVPYLLPAAQPGTTTVIDLDRMVVPEFCSLRVRLDPNLHLRLEVKGENGQVFAREVRPEEAGTGVVEFASLPTGPYEIRLRGDVASPGGLTDLVIETRYCRAGPNEVEFL